MAIWSLFENGGCGAPSVGCWVADVDHGSVGDWREAFRPRVVGVLAPFFIFGFQDFCFSSVDEFRSCVGSLPEVLAIAEHELGG